MFSKKIRDLMIEQDISLQKLADTSGVPFETLRNIYYQKVKDPKVSTAFQLAQALGVTVEYLLGENKYLEVNRKRRKSLKIIENVEIMAGQLFVLWRVLKVKQHRMNG